MTATASGFLHDGIPYLKVGRGPPLVMIQGLSPEHDVPRGFERRMALSSASPFASHFTVWWVNRKRGLAPGESMSDIAGHLADAIEHDLREPVALQGVSTGGSVALQLAVDRPDLVRRLVATASACRLGPGGRALQAEMARLIRAGRTREALSHLVSSVQPPRLRGVLRPVSWLAGHLMTPRDPNDLLVTLEAEDSFDVEADLPSISAPTLVIGGSDDVFYGRELFERTAAGVQDGRVHVFEGWGHGRTSTSSATARLTLEFLREGQG
jgi:pimeloyl-ACP methyl ester carboxylesterase